MQFSTLLFTALLPFAFAAPAPNPAAIASRQERPHAPKCVKGVHMIVASGHAVDTPHGYGLIQPTVEAIRASMPYYSSNYSVPYNHHTSNFGHALLEGSNLMKANIEWYARGCPHTPIVLLGYSEGAINMMDTLCGSNRGSGLNGAYAHNIIASIGYGDETFMHGKSYDRGTCTNWGRSPRTDSAGCAPFTGKIRSFCDEGDAECCVRSRPDASVHESYPERYDREVVGFIKERYHAFKAKKH